MSQIHLRKYGEAATINFDLFEVDGVDFRVDAVHASGDTVVMKDEGAEANTSNSFTDEGNGYSLVLTATEMQAARVVVYVVDQTATKVWLDKTIIIETYGNASAQHAFDLDTANVTLASATHTGAVIPTVTTLTGHTAQTGDSYARLGAPAGASVSADIAAAKVDTAAILVDTAEIGAAGAGLTAIPWNASWDTEVQSECADALAAYNAVATTDLPSNFGDLSITVTTGQVELLAATQASIDAIEADTNELQTDNVPGLIATAQADLDTLTGTDGVTLATSQPNYAPNTVVPDAAGTAPTAVEIRTEMDSNSTQLAKLLTDRINKNAVYSNFEFLMVLASDSKTPATGLTVTGQRSIDGAAFASVSGTITEVSNGIYQFDALAADTNGDVITWRFSAATADDTFITFNTVS